MFAQLESLLVRVLDMMLHLDREKNILTNLLHFNFNDISRGMKAKLTELNLNNV